MPTLETIPALLMQYGYILLFLVAIFEGPIITVIAAFLASAGVFNVYLVYVIAVTGDILGDAFWYWVGRLGRETIVLKVGRYFGLTAKKIKTAEERLETHFFKTIVVGKITNIFMLPIIVACGILRLDYKRYMTTALIVDIPKDLMFTVIGYYFGKSYMTIDTRIHQFNTFIIGACILIVSLYIVFYIVRKYIGTQYE